MQSIHTWILPTAGDLCVCCLPVTGAVRAGVVHTDDDEDVLEVGADVLRGERQSARLLEDDGDYVVPDVPLPQELKDRQATTKCQ